MDGSITEIWPVDAQVEGAAIVAADVADPYMLLRFDDDSAALLIADAATGEWFSFRRRALAGAFSMQSLTLPA